jgi:hypothetical protein
LARVPERRDSEATMTQHLRVPKDDPDTRPLMDRVRDDQELAKALYEWVLPAFVLIEDFDLRARCTLLLGFTIGRIVRDSTPPYDGPPPDDGALRRERLLGAVIEAARAVGLTFTQDIPDVVRLGKALRAWDEARGVLCKTCDGVGTIDGEDDDPGEGPVCTTCYGSGLTCAQSDLCGATP